MNARPPDAGTDAWDSHDDSLGSHAETHDAPLWRRLHPEYRRHEHQHPDDDPWEDQRRIDGIIEQTHADLDGHPVEQIERVLNKRFHDSNLHLHLQPDIVRAVAEGIATAHTSKWSARSLESAIALQRERDDAAGSAANTASPLPDAPEGRPADAT